MDDYQDWLGVYLGSSLEIPTQDDIYDELSRYPDGVQLKLYRKRGNYKIYKSIEIKMPPPFNGTAYIVAAFLNGKRCTYIDDGSEKWK